MREIKFTAELPDKTNPNWKRQYYVKTVDKPKDNRGAHNFKGYMWAGGYLLRKVTNHPFANKRGYYPLHRLLMEEKLGRFLKKDEVVHHINGLRHDNELENLEVIIYQSTHASIHDRGKKNPNGQYIAKDPKFNDIKYRLFDKDRKITKIYTLSNLISTTFRKGCFEYRGSFTGLYANGKEIYEGDVYQWNGYEVHANKQVRPIRQGIVDMDPYKLSIVKNIILGNGTLEIIGNIHESPELVAKPLLRGQERQNQ